MCFAIWIQVVRIKIKKYMTSARKYFLPACTLIYSWNNANKFFKIYVSTAIKISFKLVHLLLMSYPLRFTKWLVIICIDDWAGDFCLCDISFIKIREKNQTCVSSSMLLYSFCMSATICMWLDLILFMSLMTLMMFFFA